MTSTSGSAKKKSSKMYTSNGYMLFRKEFNKDNKFSNFNDMNKESSKAWRALSVGEKTIYTDRAKRGRGENKKDTIGMLYTTKDGKDKANKDSSGRTFVASLDPVLRDLHGKLMGVINDNHNRLVAAVDDELRKVQDHIQRQRKQQEEDGDDDDENGQEEDGDDDDENGQ